MQGDIESPMYQNWQFILSAMQGDIEYIDIYQRLLLAKQGDMNIPE